MSSGFIEIPVTGASGITEVTADAPLSVTNGTTIPELSISHGNLTDAGTDGITVTGGTGAVIGSGTSIAQHVADATHNGYLSSTDWSTFNNKQATALSTSGTRASANAITAVGGITAGTTILQCQFIKGSGGAVDITANPQISAGNIVGQQLVLTGTDDTNTVKLDNGTGLELNASYTMKNGSKITLLWDGTNWGEVSRNGI